MTPTVRRATPNDAASISAIVSEVLAESTAVGLDGPLSPSEVASWMERQGVFGAMFVAEEGDDLVAFAAVDFDSGRSKECSIGAWVRPNARRQGYATALAEEALAFARELGYQRVRGRLPEGNEAALSFLSTIGALVPLMNPGAQYEMPIYEERA
jgi:GNAT superfamily N-acetyltransferase